MTRDDHSDEFLSGVTHHYQIAFMWRCDCGDPDCGKPRLADADDYRVMACTLLSAIKAGRASLEAGDLKAAESMLRAAMQIGGHSLGQIVDGFVFKDPKVGDLARYLDKDDELTSVIVPHADPSCAHAPVAKH